MPNLDAVSVREAFPNTEGEERAMLRSLSDLTRCTIQATDANLGSVRDAYIDDRDWTVRYLVVQSGELSSSRGLVAPATLESSTSNPSILRVGLATKDIADDPGADEIRAPQLRE